MYKLPSSVWPHHSCTPHMSATTCQTPTPTYTTRSRRAGGRLSVRVSMRTYRSPSSTLQLTCKCMHADASSTLRWRRLAPCTSMTAEIRVEWQRALKIRWRTSAVFIATISPPPANKGSLCQSQSVLLYIITTVNQSGRSG